MRLKPILALSFALCMGSAAAAQALSQVFAFGCPGPIQPCADGAEPGSIVQASDGNLYGLSGSTDGYHSTKIGSWYKWLLDDIRQ